MRLEELEAGGEPGEDLYGRDPVVLHLIVQLEDLRDEGRLPVRGVVHERHLVEDPRADLAALRLGEHARAGLVPGEHAVAVDQLRREPVVVQDLGLLALGEVQARQRPADPQPQVLGGLVRERDAEDVAGEDPRGVDPADRGERQVDTTRAAITDRLARPGARHEHRRLERVGDRVPLLVGRDGAHRGDDLVGDLRGRAHDVASTGKTSWPSGKSGHRERKSHQWQSADGFGR